MATAELHRAEKVITMAAFAPSLASKVYNQTLYTKVQTEIQRSHWKRTTEATMNSAPSPWTIRHLLAMTVVVAVAMALFQLSVAGSAWAAFAVQVLLAGLVPWIALSAIGFLAALFAGLGASQVRNDARKSPFAEERLPDPVVRSSKTDLAD
jgi:hypothetical protein